MGYKISKGEEFEEVPAGTHLARCFAVIDAGFQNGHYGIKKELLVGWELVNTFKEDGNPFTIFRNYNPIIGKKSTFGKDLVSWLGRSFTATEQERIDKGHFDASNLVKWPGCQIVVVIEPSKKDPSKKYSNVKGVMAMPNGVPVPPLTRAIQLYTVDAPNEALRLTLDVPDWIKDKLIKACPPPDGTMRTNNQQHENMDADPVGAGAQNRDQEIPF
jgi:hypothetical protein